MPALLLSYTLIVAAQVISYGRMDAHALVLVVLGLGAGGYGFLSQKTPLTAANSARPALVLCVAASLLAALIHNPLTYCGTGLWLTTLRVSVIAAIAVLCTYLFFPDLKSPRLTSLRFGFLLALGLAARAAVPFFSPSPGEDVWVVQQEAAQAVIDGRDPYSVAFTQIFSPDVYSVFGYRSGFHYPPLSLLPISLSFGLTGDIRWAYVLCEIVVLILLWSLVSRSERFPDRESRELVLWLWAFNPSVLFILEHSWTEPLGLLLIACFLRFTVLGRRWLSAVSLALFFSYKQYTLLVFPLLFFLPGAGPTLLSFLAINVISFSPWVFMGWEGVIANLLEPWRANPRADGLSLAALWMQIRKTIFPVWISPLAIFGSLYLSMSRLARTPLGLLGALFLTLGALFLTAKQSFANYYYLLSFLLLLAAVTPATYPVSGHVDNRGDREEGPLS